MCDDERALNLKANCEYILSLSYGKDSLACLGAIEQLGLPLDRIVHAEVWATDTIPADLPPVVEFKAKADKIIKDRWGIEVEHICATQKDGSKRTYEKEFYHIVTPKRARERESTRRTTQDRLSDSQSLWERGATADSKCQHYRGFAQIKGNWCTGALKTHIRFSNQCQTRQVVQYLGIAEDEPKRLARLDGVTKVSPLHLMRWTEADAKKWCIENDLLSPIYTTATRGGCWFCHNQRVGQLRLLRRDYPELWKLLMKWDADSPVAFKADGHTVHDFDRRFEMEDKGIIYPDEPFKWAYLDNPPSRQLSFIDRGEIWKDV